METAKVMIVDTNEESRASLEALLRGHGYAVGTATDGETTIRTLADVAPDIVIMSVQLSGRNGYEITRELRDRKLIDSVPVILLTAAQTDEAFRAQHEWGVKAGAAEVLAKPVEDSTMLAKVRHLLAGGAGAEPRASSAPVAQRSGLSEHALEELERRLAQYIGPISKMLVRKTEREVDTATELYRRLAEHITDKTERDRFISWTVSQG